MRHKLMELESYFMISILIILTIIHGYFVISTKAVTDAAISPPLVTNALATTNIKPSAQPSNSLPVANSIPPTNNLGSSLNQALTLNQQGQASPKQQVTPSALIETSPAPIHGIDSVAIVNLDYSSINDELLHKNTASFVYFNAHFDHCRNCNKFFEIWKELAMDIRWWRQVVKLFVINCSDEDNIEVCRRAGVTQFPQVKFYWIMSNSLEQDGQRVRVLGKSVHAMRHLIMDKVLDSYSEHIKLLAQKRQQPAKNPNLSGNSQQPNSLMSLMGPLSQLLGGGGGTVSGNTSGLGSLIQTMTGGAKSGSNANQLSPLNLMSLLSSFSGGGGGAGGNQGLGLNQLLNFMMGASSMRQKMNAQTLPGNWPRLEPIEVGDTQKLINFLPLSQDGKQFAGALLIMETQEFLYTGLEVMLDLNPYANQTYIARVRDERGQLSKNLTNRDDIQAPALIYVTPNKESRLILTAPKYTNDEDLRRAFVRAFERKQIKYPLKRVWSMPLVARQLTASGDGSAKLIGSGLVSEEDEEVLKRIDMVYMNDLTNAIRASLMDQVFRHPDLSDDQYNALVKYVYVLINYFPFNNDENLKFFKRLHAWLQNQVSPMDINEYKKQFYDIDEVLPKRDWVACKSLSSSKSIPNKNKKSSSLFENPGQIGKVVSNITRLFRSQQQQAGKLKNLFSVFTTNMSPVLLKPLNGSSNQLATNNGTGATTPSPLTENNGKLAADSSSRNDSPLERIIKSLTSGSLGSDMSILKLISTALTGSDPATGGKSKFAREYPCGIWKMAHVMVVNEYIKDSPRKDVKHIVLHSLHQYMLQFYACSTCGNRISDVSNEFRLNLDEHLLDQSDSVLLLWKIHNRVSKRLESELRPGSPAKVQFPSEALCPKCRHSQRQQSSDLYSTPNWLDKQVLNFLVHYYRPQSIILNTNSTDSSSSIGSSASNFLSLFGLSSPQTSAAAARETTLWQLLLTVSCLIGAYCCAHRNSNPYFLLSLLLLL